jgi:hypothetical protein
LSTQKRIGVNDVSILETFYILFKSDTSDVKKGAQEVKATTDKLNQSLNATNDISRNIGLQFLSMGRNLAGVVAGFLSVGAIVNNLKSAADYTQDLSRASQALRVNISDLDAWGSAVKQAGGTAAGFQGSLRGLAEKLNTTPATALKILPQLADALHKMNYASAQRYGKAFGLDEGTILLLQQGRREVDSVIARQKELGTVTKLNAEITNKFNQQLDNTNHAFRVAFAEANNSILPILTVLYSKLEKVGMYLQQHSDLIVGGLLGIGVAAGIAAIALGVLTSPVTIITALVVGLASAFALVYEDIQAFRRGNDSVTGLLVKRWSNTGQILSDIFRAIGEGIERLFPGIRWLENAIEKLTGKRLRLFDDIDFGQKQIEFASSTPVGVFGNSSILGSTNNSNRSTNVYTGPITITTNATDSQEIATSFVTSMQDMFRQATNQWVDGELA